MVRMADAGYGRDDYLGRGTAKLRPAAPVDLKWQGCLADQDESTTTEPSGLFEQRHHTDLSTHQHANSARPNHIPPLPFPLRGGSPTRLSHCVPVLFRIEVVTHVNPAKCNGICTTFKPGFQWYLQSCAEIFNRFAALYWRRVVDVEVRVLRSRSHR